MQKILNVPAKFMDEAIIKYPPHQKTKNIEARLYSEIIKIKDQINSKLTYLPIQWTNHLIQNNYGKNIDELQQYVKSLPVENKYFSIVQYAGGPLVDIDNIIFFSAGGMFNTKINSNLSYIPIPLLSDARRSILKTKNKKYLASYLGRNTHSIREHLEKTYENDNRFYVRNLENMNIGVKDSIKFNYIMSNSIFSLCPRGFGPTSFRLYESIQMGCIPVYIADKNEHFLPFSEIIDWQKLCIIVNKKDLKNLDNVLLSIVNERKHIEMIAYGKFCLENYFNYKFVSKEIIKIVNKFD